MIVTAFRIRATHPELRSACSRTLRPSALTLDQTVRKKKIRDQPDSRRLTTHFLGAVIGGDTIEEAEAIIAPWSEYEEVPEYVVQTRDEFLKEQRGYDKQEAERHPESKDAVERLKLDDESALKAYAEYAGRTLDKDGNVISTFNEDSFYDWYEFGGRWDD